MKTSTEIKELLYKNQEVKEKICIPVINSGTEMGFKLATDFNVATHYCFVDFSDPSTCFFTSEQLKKQFADSEGKGFSGLGVTTIVCKTISASALKLLNDSGIAVLKSIEDSLKTTLEHFVAGMLTLILPKAPMEEISCSTSCGSCNSTCS